MGLIAAGGLAAEIAARDQQARVAALVEIRADALKLVSEFDGKINGDPAQILPNTVNVSFVGLDSEAAMLVLKDVVAVSNGSACTSQSYAPSHVLAAMGIDSARASAALRLSWSHLGERPDWPAISAALSPFLAATPQ